MHITIVTLFPEFFASPLACALMGKGREAGVVDFSLVNPRDFTTDRHHTADDRPYGGGPGMVMLAEPLARALESIARPGRMLLTSPRGRALTQELARELAAEESLTIVCGRYEGLDERLTEIFPLEHVRVGEAVLSGGEAAALCLVEAVARLRPGFMGHADSGEEESFSRGLLEYPHYTRPEEFRGMPVPEVLLSGDHARIARWRREQALAETLRRRPDLLEAAELDRDDLAALRRLHRDGPARPGRNLYLALVHAPVLNKFGEVTAVSLTNLDVHDIGRVSRTYGAGGLAVVTPLEDQQAMLARLLGHWTGGAGGRGNPDRAEALDRVAGLPDLDAAVDWVAAQAGSRPKVVATSARGAGDLTLPRVREWIAAGPVLLVLGTGHGLAPAVLEKVDGVLRPLRPLGGYNHLPVRAAAAILLDRLLGDAG